MAEEARKNVITRAGVKRYEDELHELKVVRRKDVAEKLKEAREQGDLSENAEYDAAKDEQREIEERIAVLEEMLKNVEVIGEEEISYDKVNVGSKVTVFDMDEDEEITYYIVGSSEANVLEGKISNESPVGRALIGGKVGDAVTVETMAGSCTYKILEIHREDEKDKKNK